MKFKESRVYKWIDKRFNITPLVDYMDKKDIPLGYGNVWRCRKKLPFPDFVDLLVHRHYVWYYFGGITLFLFLVQIVTGALLLMYYQAGENTAYESVQFIMSKVEYGWLIRSVHSWAANLMIFTGFIHMFSVLFTKAYRAPRELTWITGAIMLILAMVEGFSGYLLPWSKLSYFAVQIGTKMMDVVPVVGDFMLQLLRGGENVSGDTLHRFLGIHVTILPLSIVLLLALHLLFIQRQGMSEPLDAEDYMKKIKEKTGETPRMRTMKFFPNFILRDVVVWLIVLNVLVLLAVFFPWELGEKADPLASAPKDIRPEWFFMAMFVVLELVPKEIGITLFTIVGIIWFLIPFIDRKAKRGEKSSVMFIFGLTIFVLFVVLTIAGYLIPAETFTEFHEWIGKL